MNKMKVYGLEKYKDKPLVKDFFAREKRIQKLFKSIDKMLAKAK